MGRLLTTFKDKTFEPSMKSYYQLYTDDTSTAAQIYDSLLYVRGINAGSLAKNQEGDDDVSTVETHDTYMPIRFYNVKSKTDGATPAGPTHTFFNVYNRAEYNGPDGQNMYDLWADYNIAKLSGASYITNTIGGAYNYGYDAGSGDDQTIPGVYGALNYARIQPTGDNRTVTYAQGARNWIQVNKTNATVTYAYPTTSEFNLTDGNVGTLALHKFDLDYTAGNITNAYFIWADESSLPTPSGEKYFIKSNISWPTLLSGALTNTGAVTFGSTLSVSGTATLSSNVNIGGNLVVTGTSTFNGGTITIGDAASDNVVFGADVDSHIIPDDDNTYDLGSALQEWRDLYIDGTAYVDTLSLSNNLDLADDIKIRFGDSQDLQIYHSSTTADSYIQNTGGSNNLVIQQDNNDKAIEFWCDSGSGGITRYMKMAHVSTVPHIGISDNIKLSLGNGNDFHIVHSGTSTSLVNSTGDIFIKNDANGADIRFDCENGSNGTTEYFRLDGSSANSGTVYTVFPDSSNIALGSSKDLRLYHDGSNSFIDDAGTGDLYIRSSDNMYFQTYGSGKKWITLTEDAGVELFYNDSKKFETTSAGVTVTGQATVTNGIEITGGNANFADNSYARFGASADLQIYHNGGNSYIDETGTGSLYIKSAGAIRLQSDTGENMIYMQNDAGVNLYHNNVNKLTTTSTGATVAGSLTIDDSIIHTGDSDTYFGFQTDNKIQVVSGGTTAFDVTSGATRFATSTRFVANATFDDSSKAIFGEDSDLQIYHDGSNSYIDETGTGDLIVKAVDDVYIRGNTHDMGRFNEQGVKLYNVGNVKFETTSTGTKTTGQMNLAALNSAPSSASDTGTVGEIRFTSDYIYVCVASNTWKRAALSTW